ncbi:MAG: DUF695 domain-containing protein [Phycisphaerae bacterium]|nr:DUF695 domain-containing protein [Phycisphaerae bacterium]NIU59091.1 DUF695 domain-containing protein [Phycisphaerae bacterium]NIV68864.1 DUF695 domain-containing protein [Phycisphaerae bacterium]NIW95794.1 DUF695 domain-containing protein [Phycisphaerae bacterium]NIX27979.1 DUF695 domain-containing protein [Phycisphaerae bacterium]
MTEDYTSANQEWLTGQVDYEGFPLLLRRPKDLDYDLLKDTFPNLVVVTHQFAKTKPSGLPEDDYNLGLADFDYEVVNYFRNRKQGITVLVETFGGKRNYYMYAATDADADKAKAHFKQNYPEHNLSWVIKNDPDWGFIKAYAKECF